jgi:hypothetical protein
MSTPVSYWAILMISFELYFKYKITALSAAIIGLVRSKPCGSMILLVAEYLVLNFVINELAPLPFLVLRIIYVWVNCPLWYDSGYKA